MLAPTTHTTNAQYARTLNRMGWCMLIFIGLFNMTTSISASALIIRELVVSPRWSTVLTAISGILESLCYITPFFLTGLLYYAMSRRTSSERLSLEVKIPREFPLWILAGLAVLTAAAYVNAQFCQIIGYTMPTDVLLDGNYDDPSVIIQYMTVAIAPAFAEEFLFRGVFYNNLRPFGRTQAILISAFLFALMHQNIGQLFYTFVAGIVMAIMFEVTGSIWCSVFFHLFNNEISVLYDVLIYGRYGEAINPYLSILDAVLFLLGMVSIVLLVRYYRNLARVQATTGLCGIYGAREGSMENEYENRPCLQTVDVGTVVKGMLSPGMVVFTATTVVLMGITWLLLALYQGGAFA
jgi:membrane protease YdiL (CAAX protease family)